jgi:transcriptional regulator with XRE-family HTH domain
MRRAKGLTQQALADLCESITVRGIRRYETCYHLPHLSLAVQLARALECSLDELVGWR